VDEKLDIQLELDLNSNSATNKFDDIQPTVNKSTNGHKHGSFSDSTTPLDSMFYENGYTNGNCYKQTETNGKYSRASSVKTEWVRLNIGGKVKISIQ
jgi:hypothetical protein